MADARARLERIVAELRDGVVVAFSGGVDSAVLLKACADVVGERVLAVTADSPSYPPHDRADALRIVAELGVRHRMVQTHEFDDERYRQNAADRCYFCKHSLFETLAPIAAASGLPHLAFGANHDDRGDFRPGHRAADEFHVRAPLLEAGLGKDDVRRLARAYGLAIWDKPASACLASRIPYGTRIEAGELARVAAAETLLRELGYRQCRVRHHGDVARVEVAVDDLLRAATQDRAQIQSGLAALGWSHVALDLAGFKSGSMNAALGPDLTARG